MKKRVLYYGIGLLLIVFLVSGIKGCAPAVECIKEGECSSSANCCEGLVAMPMYEVYDTLGCAGVECGDICVKCGDGECGLGENFCNCLLDCPVPENFEFADLGNGTWKITNTTCLEQHPETSWICEDWCYERISQKEIWDLCSLKEPLLTYATIIGGNDLLCFSGCRASISDGECDLICPE